MMGLKYTVKLGRLKLYVDDLVTFIGSFGIGLYLVPAISFARSTLYAYFNLSPFTWGSLHLGLALLGLYASNAHNYQLWRIFCIACCGLFGMVAMATFFARSPAVGLTYALLSILSLRKGKVLPVTKLPEVKPQKSKL